MYAPFGNSNSLNGPPILSQAIRLFDAVQASPLAFMRICDVFVPLLDSHNSQKKLVGLWVTTRQENSYLIGTLYDN